MDFFLAKSNAYGRYRTLLEGNMVPLAGLEPALLAELDFESSASTNFTTGAFDRYDHVLSSPST